MQTILQQRQIWIICLTFQPVSVNRSEKKEKEAQPSEKFEIWPTSVQFEYNCMSFNIKAD
jgi:hypothetical protein